MTVQTKITGRLQKVVKFENEAITNIRYPHESSKQIQKQRWRTCW